MFGPSLFDGNDLDELRTGGLPVGEETLCERGTRAFYVLVEETEELLLVCAAGFDGREVDRVEVAAEVEVAGLVEDVGDAAGHARAEVDASRAENDDLAAGHVLAAVVADAFRDERDARVADGEALAGLSV